MLHATTISFTSCVSRIRADLTREASHLVQRPRAVGEPGVVAEVDEVLVRQRDEALVQDGQAADTGVEHADGPRIHGGDRRTGLPCRRSWAAEVSSFAVALRCARLERLGARSDAAAADDRGLGRREARLLGSSCPTRPRPPAASPASCSSTGSAASTQDMEPLATQFLAPAGYETLECDARGHGASRGPLRARRPARRAGHEGALHLARRRAPAISDTQIGALGISLGGGAVWNAAVGGVPFKAIVPVITWTNLATALAPQGLSKSGLVS